MTAEPNDVQASPKVRAQAAREELAATLDAIEYKLNVPKRVQERVRRMRAENPIALALAVAVGVGAVVTGTWLCIRALLRH